MLVMQSRNAQGAVVEKSVHGRIGRDYAIGYNPPTLPTGRTTLETAVSTHLRPFLVLVQIDLHLYLALMCYNVTGKKRIGGV